MELKFKKTLLLAMRMNSAHKRIIKMSPNSIVNMEMFTKVCNLMYFSRTLHIIYLNYEKYVAF